MKREILINATPRETRVAILEDDQLVELLVDRPEARRMVGDIYFGRVEAVLPGIQAAFVDIGTEKSAFLHASDLVYPEDGEPDDDADEEGDDEAGDAPADDSPYAEGEGEETTEQRREGAVAAVGTAAAGRLAPRRRRSRTCSSAARKSSSRSPRNPSPPRARA